MGPREQTRCYWQELIDLEKRYAGDLEELQSRLQVQAHAANRDKVQSYLDRTSRILSQLRMPKPANIDSAPLVTLEQIANMLSVKRMSESMATQLKALRDKKRPSHGPGAAAAHQGAALQPDAQQQQRTLQQQRLQQQQHLQQLLPGYGAAATPEEVLSRPPAAPSPLGAPSPSPGAAAVGGAAATPPIGLPHTSYIQPEIPPAAVLPSSVLPAAAGAAAAQAAAAAQPAAAAAVAPAAAVQAQPAAAGAAAVAAQQKPGAAAPAGEAVAAAAAAAAAAASGSAGINQVRADSVPGAAVNSGATQPAAAAAPPAAPSAPPQRQVDMSGIPDTPLGHLQRAMLTASDAQLQKAYEQQSQALCCVPSYAALGPLPDLQDLTSAADPADASDGSAASTVPLVPLQPPPRVFSRTVCTRYPEGYTPQEGEEAALMDSSGRGSLTGAAAAAAAAGDATAAAGGTVGGSGRKRVREGVAEAVSAVGASLQGSAQLWLLDGGQQQQGSGGADEGGVEVCVECVLPLPDMPDMPTSQQQQGGRRAAMAAAAAEPAWKRLKAVLPEGDPHRPPVLVRTYGMLLPGSEPAAVEAADGSSFEQQLQLGLSGLAWEELQVRMREEPAAAADLAGAAKQWCAAVQAVAEAQL